jgi:mono/diheme cytochrome c family protein
MRAPILLAFTVACAGVPVAEHEATVGALKRTVDERDASLAAARAEGARASAERDAAKADVDKLRAEVIELKASLERAQAEPPPAAPAPATTTAPPPVTTTAPRPPSPLAATPAPPAAGREVYAKKCASCHGDDGRADTKMGKKTEARAFTDRAWQSSVNDAAVRRGIADGTPSGKPAGHAYAGKLTPAEIDALVAMVRAFGK